MFYLKVQDVKSSWRKAVEEDKAEKMGRFAKYDDSITGRLTPLNEHDVSPSTDAHSQTVSGSLTPPVTSLGSPPVSQQGVKSTLLWDTLLAEAQDSVSGTGSSAMQFSLDHETLPEMPSCDSLLSLDDDDDEALDMKSEDDELLIPSLKTGALSPLATRGGQTFADGSRQRTPECLLSDHKVSALDRDWLLEPAKPVEATGKVFSLDLDALKTPSPPKKQEYSLPKLITFSPIDDMKC